MSVLAVDMGGTNIKVGLVRDGIIVRRESIVSHSEAGAAQAMERLASLLRSMREPDCTGVGLALPTLVDVRINKVCAQMIGKFDGLTDVDFDAWSSREVDLPIRIENDAHAAILGEWRLGAGIGCDNLVMMTLGTGIGTSVIIGGRPLRGKHAQAGNLGSHMVMDPHGFKCVCGLQGCGEAQQHRSHIADIAKHDSRFPNSALSDAPTIDYAALFAHAVDDELARDLLNRSLDIWGSIATSLVHQFDCERLIVGGGIMKSASIIMPHIQSWLDRACTPWGTCESRASELGDDAGLFGMASCFEVSLDYI